MANQLKLSIDSDLRAVSLLAVAVNAACMHLGLEKAQAGEAELCVVEAVTNVIRHAYKGQPGHCVQVALSRANGCVQLNISDSGESMKPDRIHQLVHGTHQAPEEELHRGSLAEGGRGLQIMHELMDTLAYETNGKTNCLSMAKRLPDSEHDS